MGKNDYCTSVSLKSRIADSRTRLYRVALAWCGDEMLADDLAQETMTNGMTNIRQLRDQTRLFAWLYSILNNNWRLHLRRKKSHDELDDEMPGDELGPMGHYHEREVVTRVRRPWHSCRCRSDRSSRWSTWRNSPIATWPRSWISPSAPS